MTIQLVRRCENSFILQKVAQLKGCLGAINGMRGIPSRSQTMTQDLITSNIQGLFKCEQIRLIYNGLKEKTRYFFNGEIAQVYFFYLLNLRSGQVLC